MRSRIMKRNLAALFITTVLALPWAGVCSGQETRPTAAAETQTPKVEEGATAPGADAAVPKADEKNGDMVALNLKDANVDKILKFLSELTGKPVMKHREAKAKITISSAAKIPRQDAIRMVCEALRIEKVAVVERDGIIWLVPEKMVSGMSIGLVLDDEDVPMIGIISKSIPVKFIDRAEIEKLIKPLLSPNATLIVHPGADKIIVTDTVARIAHLEQVMAELDVLAVADRKVQIFQLEHADAEQLAPILTAILATPGGAKAAPPGKKPPKPAASSATGDQVVIQAYKTANWLIVVTPEEKLPEVVKLIDQFDREMVQELRLRIISVKYAEASALANQLSALLKRRYEKRLRDTVEIVADTRSNALMVYSSEANFKTISAVVRELDSEESVQTQTKWYELEHADPEDMAEQMNELYSGSDDSSGSWYYWYRPRQQKATTRFVAEPRTNSLVVIAPPNEFAKIDELVKRLDVSTEADQVAPRIFPLKYTEAKELTEVLNTTFGAKETEQSGYWYYRNRDTGPEIGQLYGKVRFDALVSSNSIIVTTNNQKNFAIIENFINELDKAVPAAANLLVIPLKNARAADVAEQLNILFAREGAKAPEKKEDESAQNRYYSFLFGDSGKKDERPVSNLIGRVRVVPDMRTNSLLVTTAVQNHDAIRLLVDGLDTSTPKVYVRVRLIAIDRTKASRIGTRFTSDPTIFDTEEFNNGLLSSLGFGWEEVHGNGVLNASVNATVLVQFLAENFKTTILEDTSISTSDNEEARIFVGSQIPFITDSTVTDTGGVASSFDYKLSGTELKITPNVNPDGKVVMDIYLENTRAREGEVILGGQVLDTRTIETVLAVADGETIVMGGIMMTQELVGRRGFPILRHIPIVNWVFGKRDKKTQAQELVAFITPTVLRDADDDKAITRKVADTLEGEHDFDPLDEDLQKGD